MGLLFRLLLLVIFLVPLALAGGAILALSDSPTVNRSAEISSETIERAKRILDQNDPRKLKPGAVRTITVNQQDFDLAANYLAHQYGNASSRMVLSGSAIKVSASVRLPSNPFGRFVNVDAILRENGVMPRFARLQIGRLPVPDRVADWLLDRSLALYLGEEAYGSALDAIKQVRVSDQTFALTYEWQPHLPDKLRKALLPPEDQERIRLYHARLTNISRSLTAANVSLVQLAIPLFELAQAHSRGGDSITENRAAILVLTFYVSDKELTRFVPTAKDWPPPAAHHVTLNGRADFAQHFIVSAAIAANAGGLLSEAVGLYKEIADARDGSGFSFNDIAADRAGTRFGELAAGSSASARKLQKQLSAGVNERDLMPETEDLPEFLSEAEFRSRFGGIDAPEYNKMMAEIERRVAGLSLYR
jgi:uncharacterized protein YfiM (DUF2279 family)